MICQAEIPRISATECSPWLSSNSTSYLLSATFIIEKKMSMSLAVAATYKNWYDNPNISKPFSRLPVAEILLRFRPSYSAIVP